MWDEIKVLKVIFLRRNIQHIYQSKTSPWGYFTCPYWNSAVHPAFYPEPVSYFTDLFGMLLTLIFRRMDRTTLLMKQIWFLPQRPCHFSLTSGRVMCHFPRAGSTEVGHFGPHLRIRGRDAVSGFHCFCPMQADKEWVFNKPSEQSEVQITWFRSVLFNLRMSLWERCVGSILALLF